MRIQRFPTPPETDDIKVCRVCGFDEREINVYERDGSHLCVECLDEQEVFNDENMYQL